MNEHSRSRVAVLAGSVGLGLAISRSMRESGSEVVLLPDDVEKAKRLEASYYASERRPRNRGSFQSRVNAMIKRKASK